MDIAFLLKFIFKNLAAHRLRTLLTIFAMMIGIATIVFLISFAFGLEKLVTREITGGRAFELIDVGPTGSRLVKLDKKNVEKISKISNVKAVEPLINAGARIKRLGDKEIPEGIDASFVGITSRGMDWAGLTVSSGQLLSQTSYGEATNLDAKIIINDKLANIAEYGETKGKGLIGKKIKLEVIIPQEISKEEKNVVYENKEFEVIGLVNSGSSPIIYTNLNNFEEFGIRSFSQAKVETVLKNQIPIVRKQIENLGFSTQYIGEIVDQVRQVFNFFKAILGGFGLIAIIIASLGMFNILTISLLERIKEVALLKIIGMKRKDIRKIFFSEAIMMGMGGGVLGIALGIGVSKIVNQIFNSYALEAGGEPVVIFLYPFWFLLLVFIFAVLIGVITGLYPAIRASRIDALNVLRYE